MAERVVRRWVVGIVSCDDVRALQKQINAYRSSLGDSLDALSADMKGTVGPRGTLAWKELGERCSQFEEESCTLGLFAGSQYDRGAALIKELDGWRDWLASVKAPSLPEPVPVPHSDVSLFGAAFNASTLLIALAALYLLKR
jgi:hypothetical protein